MRSAAVASDLVWLYEIVYVGMGSTRTIILECTVGLVANSIIPIAIATSAHQKLPFGHPSCRKSLSSRPQCSLTLSSLVLHQTKVGVVSPRLESPQ